MNNYSKMRRTNAILKEHLNVEENIFDMVVFPHTRHFKDVWGLWDAVGKKPTRDGFRVVWVQFKTGYASKKDKKRMGEFCDKSNQSGILAERIQKSPKKHTVRITRFGKMREAHKTVSY